MSKTLAVDIIKELDHVQVSLRLKEQLISASNSIASNLAEMSAFDSKPAQIQKVHVCLGECNEAENDLDVLYESGKLDIAKHRNFTERVRTIRKMLICLLKSMGWQSSAQERGNTVIGEQPTPENKNRYWKSRYPSSGKQENKFPFIRGRAGT